jgi:Tfp pilus assembly protein PilN
VSQQVNLYRPAFRKQKRRFSATAMLQAAALALAGIGALYGYSYWQVRQLRAEVLRTDQQFAGLQKRLEEITRQFGERVQSKDLQNRVQRLQEQLAEKQRLQQLLQTAQFNTQGFADYFAAFARQHLPGVWITGLEITGAAEQLILTGRSTDPELVPRYLQRLSAESRLRGIEFRSFQMTRGAADAKDAPAAYVEFVARTADGAPPRAGSP